MNKIYKIVKNAQGTSVASELAKGSKKKKLLGLAILSSVLVTGEAIASDPPIYIGNNFNINETYNNTIISTSTTPFRISNYFPKNGVTGINSNITLNGHF